VRSASLYNKKPSVFAQTANRALRGIEVGALKLPWGKSEQAKTNKNTKTTQGQES